MTTPTQQTPGSARNGARRAAVVVNPTKVRDQDALREACEKACATAGWGSPLWLETTPEDRGVGQTTQALREGVDIVFAAGGDGTVRLVGSALAGSEVPLGLMPAGTGNLLARNLGVQHLGSAAESFARSLDGEDTVIDVGRVHATFDDGTALNDTFLIMAGYGLDGDIMDSTSEPLKKRIGWMAYPVAGLQYLTERPERMIASFDDGLPQTRKTTTLLIGNCGRLTAGVELMPGAVADDGWFDAVWLSADGPLQWARLTKQILARSSDGTQLERKRTKRVDAKAMGRPRALELDGDVVGRVREAHLWIDPKSLSVRVPRKDSASRSPIGQVAQLAPSVARQARKVRIPKFPTP